MANSMNTKSQSLLVKQPHQVCTHHTPKKSAALWQLYMQQYT